MRKEGVLEKSTTQSLLGVKKQLYNRARRMAARITKTF
jgi:hypothetical protein